MVSIRIGIVGASFGVNAYLPALQHHPDFEIVALASPNSAPAAAQKFGIPQAYQSCEQMVERAEVDAVAIVSPPFAHLGAVTASLRAGKHVLCEEPFGLSVAEAEAMIAAEKASGKACGVACDLRFIPQSHELKSMLAKGRCEPVREIEITAFRQALRRTVERPRGWFFQKEKGGGIAGAVLSHLIDYANWLAARPPLRSTGLLRTANPTRHDHDGAEFASTVDDGAFALVDYGGGLVARLSADHTLEIDQYTCAVHGEERGALATGPNISELTLYRIDKDESDEMDCAPSKYSKYAFNTNVPPLMEILDEWVKKIKGEPNVLPSFDEALLTQKVLESIGYGASSPPLS